MPVAHTCFFALDLPKYSTKKILREKLTFAITHGTKRTNKTKKKMMMKEEEEGEIEDEPKEADGQREDISSI